jgi:hypothetical protein
MAGIDSKKTTIAIMSRIKPMPTAKARVAIRKIFSSSFSVSERDFKGAVIGGLEEAITILTGEIKRGGKGKKQNFLLSID